MGRAQAAALTLAAGTTTNVTGPADTIDTLTQSGAPTANLNFDLSGSGATTAAVEISGFGSVKLGDISVSGTNSPQDTAILTDRAIVLTVNGDITGKSETGGSSAAKNLKIVVKPMTAVGYSLAFLKGNVDAATSVVLQSSSQQYAIMIFGNENTTKTFAGNLDMQGAGMGLLVIKKNSTFSGAIDLASAPSKFGLLYMQDGSVLSGSVSNSKTIERAQINIAGNATIGGGASSLIVNATSDSRIIIFSDKTLTLAGTGEVKVGVITVSGYNGGDGVLAVTGANKKITATINGGGFYGSGMIAISGGGTTTIDGDIGTTRSLKSITLAPGTKAAFTKNVSANSITVSNTATNTFGGHIFSYIDLKADATIAVAANKRIFGMVVNTTGSNGVGTLSFAQTTSNTSLISNYVGGTYALKAVNASAASGTATFGGFVKATTINIGSGAGTVVFAKGAQVTNLNAGGTGTLNFGGDLTATQGLKFTAAGQVSVDADKKIVGSVTTTADGQGTLKFSNATTATTLVSGTVGTPTKALLKVTAGGNGGAASFGGNIYAKSVNIANTLPTDTVKFAGAVTSATTFDFSTDGIVDFNGTTKQTITAPITTSAGTATGDVTVSNVAGTVNFASSLGADGGPLGTVTLNPGTRTVFASTMNVGDFVISGKKVTFNGKVSVTNTGSGSGTLTIADGSTIKIGSGFANGDTVIAASGAVTDAGTIAVEMPSSIRNGQSLNIVTGASGVGTAIYEATGSQLFTYATMVTNDTSVSVKVTRRSAASLSQILNISSRRAMILYDANAAAASGDAPAASAIMNAIAAGGATAQDAADQMSPREDTMGAVDRTTINTGENVFNIASNRLAAMRVGKMYASNVGETGFSSGDASLNMTGWFKAFGNRTTQTTVGTAKGFKADTYGSDFGIDRAITDNTRLGASFSFARTSVYGYGSAKEQTNTKSYQLTVYGDYTAENFFITAMTGFALNKNNTTRTIVLSGLNRMANGRYNSNQFMLSVRGGVPLLISRRLFFTPNAGLAWTYVQTDTYTETGAGTLNLKVTPGSVNTMIASVGGTTHMQFKAGRGYLIPELRAGLSYDLAGDSVTATGQFTGGGAAFKTTGAKFSQLAENAGLGVTYDDGAWSLSGNYDGNFKKGYVSSSGTLEARVKF